MTRCYTDPRLPYFTQHMMAPEQSSSHLQHPSQLRPTALTGTSNGLVVQHPETFSAWNDGSCRSAEIISCDFRASFRSLCHVNLYVLLLLLLLHLKRRHRCSSSSSRTYRLTWHKLRNDARKSQEMIGRRWCWTGFAERCSCRSAGQCHMSWQKWTSLGLSFIWERSCNSGSLARLKQRTAVPALTISHFVAVPEYRYVSSANVQSRWR